MEQGAKVLEDTLTGRSRGGSLHDRMKTGAHLARSMHPPDVRGYRAQVADVRALVTRAAGVTLVRADRVYGRDHLLHAASLAKRAVEQGRARSADVATETMLYAAGERQIHKAIARMGLAEGMRHVAAVSIEPGRLDELAMQERWIRDDAVMDGGEAVLDAFGITEKERAMVPRERWQDLVLERVALVDVLKA